MLYYKLVQRVNALSDAPKPLRGPLQLFAATLFTCVLVSASFGDGLRGSALAQGDDDAVRAAARRLGEQGIEAYSAGDFGAAAAKLDQGFRLYPSPTLGLWCARARVQLQRMVEASERYREAVRAPLPAVGDRAAQAEAQRDAARELEALLPRIPSLTVRLAVPNPRTVQVTLDGAELPQALIGALRPTNPGIHDLVAMRGQERQLITVQLDPGQQQTVTFDFKAASKPQTTNAVAAGLSADTAPMRAETSRLIADEASDQTNIRGSFMFGLRSQLLNYTNETDNYAARVNVSSFTAGIGLPSLQLGYGVSDSLLLSVLLRVSGGKASRTIGDREPGHSGAFSFGIGPLLDYEFHTHSNLRPFLGAGAWIALNPEDSSGRSSWVISPGLRAGLHCFATPSVSFDAVLAGGGTWGHGSEKNFYFHGVVTDSDASGSISSGWITLHFGISAWLD